MPAVEGAADVIQEVTGARPTACPWWSVEEPIVREVLALHAAMLDEVAAVAIDMQAIPNRVADGLRVYRRALARSSNELAARKHAKLKEGSDG